MRRPASLQPDLFGDYETAERAEQRRQAERADWAARFERPQFYAPWTSSTATEGDIITGWRCPDCHDIEWGSFTLSLNHGYDPHRPGDRPYGDDHLPWGAGTCHRLRHNAMQGVWAAVTKLHSADGQRIWWAARCGHRDCLRRGTPGTGQKLLRWRDPYRDTKAAAAYDAALHNTERHADQTGHVPARYQLVTAGAA